MKRLLILLLSVAVLVAGLLPTAVFAAASTSTSTSTLTDTELGNNAASHGVTATYLPHYNVTLASDIVNGSVASDKYRARADETVTLTVIASSEYTLDTLTVKCGSDVVPAMGSGETYTFTMPAGDVSVAATFKEITYPAVINGVSISTDNGAAVNSGVVVVFPDTATVTVTVRGENFKGLGDRNRVKLFGDKDIPVTAANGWAIDTSAGTATRNFSSSELAMSLSGNFDVSFTNDGGDTYTTVGLTLQYQAKTISVSVEWGSLKFTYEDAASVGASDIGWTCSEGANIVKVKNGSNVAVSVRASYTAEDEELGVSAVFDRGSVGLARNGEVEFALTLSGKPNRAIATGTCIGYVTISIGEIETITDAAGLKALFADGGSAVLGGDIAVGDVLTLASGKTVELELGGHTLTAGRSGREYVINMEENCALTISAASGGSITCVRGVDATVIAVGSGGTLTVNGGELIGGTDSNACAVNAGAASTVLLNGGSFSGEYSVRSESSDARITITGGSYLNAIHVGSNVLTVRGGEFKFDPSEYVDADHTVTETAGTWTVRAKNRTT